MNLTYERGNNGEKKGEWIASLHAGKRGERKKEEEEIAMILNFDCAQEEDGDVGKGEGRHSNLRLDHLEEGGEETLFSRQKVIMGEGRKAFLSATRLVRKKIFFSYPGEGGGEEEKPKRSTSPSGLLILVSPEDAPIFSEKEVGQTRFNNSFYNLSVWSACRRSSLWEGREGERRSFPETPGRRAIASNRRRRRWVVFGCGRARVKEGGRERMTTT